MKTVAELVEKNRAKHEEMAALAKDKPLRYMLWGTKDEDDLVSVLKPSTSLEPGRGFLAKPQSRGVQVRPFDEKMQRAFEFLLSFERSFSLFTSPTMRFFVTKHESGWELVGKCLYDTGQIGVYSAGKGHAAERVCSLVEGLLGSFAKAGRWAS